MVVHILLPRSRIAPTMDTLEANGIHRREVWPVRWCQDRAKHACPYRQRAEWCDWKAISSDHGRARKLDELSGGAPCRIGKADSAEFDAWCFFLYALLPWCLTAWLPPKRLECARLVDLILQRSCTNMLSRRCTLLTMLEQTSLFEVNLEAMPAVTPPSLGGHKYPQWHSLDCIIQLKIYILL